MASGGSEERDGRVGLALFGFGRMGRIHFETLMEQRHLAELVYLVDDVTGPLYEAKLKHRLHGTTVVEVAETTAVLEDARVEGILICTPTNSHFPLIQAALSAGKAVFCEKPVAMTLQEVKDCYRKAAEVGKDLVCGLCRRFDPANIAIKHQVCRLAHPDLVTEKTSDVKQSRCF